MLNIEKLYLTEKEAAYRYGYSVEWFQLKRRVGGGPPFIKINKAGKILYPLTGADNWFAGFGLQKNDGTDAVER